jgi:hypothetical protein
VKLHPLHPNSLHLSTCAIFRLRTDSLPILRSRCRSRRRLRVCLSTDGDSELPAGRDSLYCSTKTRSRRAENVFTLDCSEIFETYSNVNTRAVIANCVNTSGKYAFFSVYMDRKKVKRAFRSEWPIDLIGRKFQVIPW